ncbi:MAG TPA: 5-formyltetrahydrofolate cyclo-ligase [Usitatibacter sp.]|nr:5-formyltetrahydrofolate cyclo-ligase [Usitatibacter sp.]
MSTNVKGQLRSEMIARRDALPQAERDRLAAAFTAQLVAMPEYAAARSVLATMAIGSEWNTRPFLDRARADGKTVVLPRLTPPPRRLALHSVEDLDRQLIPGVWDIPEPDPDRCAAVTLADVDFAVIPALTMDRSGYRIGYGAGYFDRLLTGRGNLPFCVTALPAPFIVESLPHEPHDVPVDRLIDERGTVVTLRKLQ